jgi:hypothetical protein
MRGLGFFDNAVHSFYTCIFYGKNTENNFKKSFLIVIDLIKIYILLKL